MVIFSPAILLQPFLADVLNFVVALELCRYLIISMIYASAASD